jgi:phosphonate transport system substrate-binding protein
MCSAVPKKCQWRNTWNWHCKSADPGVCLSYDRAASTEHQAVTETAMKRAFVARAAAILLLAWGAQGPGAWAQQAVYNFSPVNQYDINLTAAYWNPIIAYVSEKSGVKLNLKIGRTSADTTSYVLAKEVEFVFSNHLFSPEREQLGWKVFARRNAESIQAQVVVPVDSPITDVAQLKGQSVAFAGPEAFFVYKVPYAYMLSKNVDVKVVFAGNQNAALAQLVAGKVVAAGGNSQLVDGYSRREGKKFRVLWSSEPFVDLPLMASSKVPEADARKVAAAFIDMYKDPKGRDILHQASKEVGMSNDAYFVPSSAADYAPYKRFYLSAPVSLH